MPFFVIGKLIQCSLIMEVVLPTDLNSSDPDECNEHSISLDAVPNDDLFQFRLIQREHAGVGCNCWILRDVTVSSNNQSTRRFA